MEQGRPRLSQPGSRLLHQQERANTPRRSPVTSQRLRLPEQHVLTPSMLLPEDGICVLDIISVGSKPLALLLSQTMSPSSQAKFSLYIFIHSNGGPWSEASRGFQSGFGRAITDSRCLVHWLRTPTLLWHASTSLPLFLLKVAGTHHLQET